MPLGNRGPTNPSTMLSSLMTKREKLQDQLRTMEKQIYELETNYLQDLSHFRHALRGFEGFLSSSKNTANLKRSRKFQPEDRLFSLSSVTSPVAEELGLQQDDGRYDFGPGRFKGGGLTAAGQGKPKKGRTGSSARYGKRNRPSSEQDFGDEDVSYNNF